MTIVRSLMMVVETRQDGQHPNAQMRKPRKSRSRGLRTRTGCLTCRKRHKKCDEREPVCGSCRLANRACVYGETRPSGAGIGSVDVTQAMASVAPVVDGSTERSTERSTSATTATEATEVTAAETTAEITTETAASTDPEPYPDNTVFPFSPDDHSVISSERLSVGGASNRWLDLLATDAAQADTSFSLAPTPAREGWPYDVRVGTDATAAVDTTTWQQQQTQQTQLQPQPQHQQQHQQVQAESQQAHPWQQSEDIVLSEHEKVLFRHFVEHAALWLDVMDPQLHFSTYAIRLALRNLGLMKAILALSARHASVSQKTLCARRLTPEPSHEQAIQYYYETLHYLQTALQHRTYTFSEEILATAIIISTYEMLDESASNWKRHLRGVFWIQRSQDVNGGSGGLRQAVWWAWLRQDIWAAFRERRPCFSFWVAVKDCVDLTQDELADRSIYLLSQAVNYAAIQRDPQEQTPAERIAEADNLYAEMETWKSCLGPGFRPLPSPAVHHVGDDHHHQHNREGTETTTPPFTPIWIHPPSFALAIMAYNMARILITLYRPAEPGFAEHLKIQKTLHAAVAQICGIAMTLKDEGRQILASQCLYAAGLCVHQPAERATVISLVQACERRTGWPMTSICQDLQAEWHRVDNESSAP